MPVLDTPSTPVTPRSFSLDELNRWGYLPSHFDVSEPVGWLDIAERSMLEAAVTALVPSTRRKVRRAQRELFLAIIETRGVHPLLRAYCEAATELSVDDWDYFAHYYQVKPGDKSLLRINDAYLHLCPIRY